MNKIDFSRLKEIPIDAVLGHYGIQTRKRNGAYLVAPCPLPSHTSKDSAYSFAVNIEKNLWTCHSDSCKKASGMKGGDVIDLVCLLEGTRLPMDGARKLADLFPQYEKPAHSQSGGAGEFHGNHTAVPEKNKPLAFTLKDVNPHHEEIQRRKITEETARSFGVGFFPGKGSMANRVVFPIHEDGALVAYIGRTCGDITPDNPKWKVPAGFIKSMLFGLDRCDPSKPLVIVESPWAVMWLSQHNIQAAALLGCEMTAAQEKVLEPFATIQLALDNDEPGRVATEKLAERLRGKHRVIKAFFRE
jgi:hypothetical protein